MSSVFAGIANLATSSLMQYVYSLTVDSSPGTVFFISAGFEAFSLVATSVLFYFVLKHEEIFGEIGNDQKERI